MPARRTGANSCQQAALPILCATLEKRAGCPRRPHDDPTGTALSRVDSVGHMPRTRQSQAPPHGASGGTRTQAAPGHPNARPSVIIRQKSRCRQRSAAPCEQQPSAVWFASATDPRTCSRSSPADTRAEGPPSASAPCSQVRPSLPSPALRRVCTTQNNRASGSATRRGFVVRHDGIGEARIVPNRKLTRCLFREGSNDPPG